MLELEKGTTMNPWNILGIEPTDNKKEIKKAYTKLLKMFHPEEHQ